MSLLKGRTETLGAYCIGRVIAARLGSGGAGLQRVMQRNKQGNDIPTEPDSMEQADAVNGEQPADAHASDEAHRTGEDRAVANKENESPA